jgi:preprotein translocase subunit SecE
MLDYIKDTIQQLKLTKWLSTKELIGLVIYTIVLCGIIAMISTGLDLSYKKIFTDLLNIPFI